MNYATEDYVDVNQAELCGIIKSELIFSHKTYGENFYNFTLGIERNSGYEDEIIITISERLLNFDYPKTGQMVKILGQVRTYNELKDGKNHLDIVVFARNLDVIPKESKFLSDYVHCISWGRNAIFSEGLKVGDRIIIVGRLQRDRKSTRLNSSHL